GPGATRASSFMAPPGPVPIPDRDATGVASPLAVSETLPALALEVTVDVAHPDAGDLVIALTAPGGETVTLHNLSGAGTPYGLTTYPTGAPPDGPGSLADLLGLAPAGTWTLRVVDGRS